MDDTNTTTNTTTNTIPTTRYRVIHAHGVTEPAVDAYDEAVASVRSVYGADAAIGHSGDIADGGERTLVWADQATADDDDGSRAVAEIRASHR